jgi:hypothetical protein
MEASQDLLPTIITAGRFTTEDIQNFVWQPENICIQACKK